jgi:glycosyltransferase involved in cell wall biosynthesis
MFWSVTTALRLDEPMAHAAEPSASLCHVNLARGFRGGERQTELLVRALVPHVPSQVVIARRGAPLETRLAGVPGVRVIGVAGRLAAALAMRGVRLIHAHENGGAQAAFLASLATATPYIITRRVDNMPKAAVVTLLMYRRARATVVLSRAIGDVLERLAPALRCRRVADASSDLASDPEWVSAFRGRYRGKTVVGHIGAFDYSHKGQDTLLEAARLLEAEQPEIQLVLVGAGRDEDRVRETAAGLANVDVVGWVDNVGDYLAAFDLFVMPSVREGLGSILLDAMQFGLPIVATRAGGIPDVIVHEENGLLVPVSEPRALATAIRRLAADTETRRRMAESNRAAARAYTAAAMAARYIEIYRESAPELVASGNPP